MTPAEYQIELRKWQKAVEDSRTTRQWLEERGDRQQKRIRALEAQVRSLGGKP